MKFSLGISNFLEEISSLSHSVLFLFLLALITEDSFLFPCYSLVLCIQMCIVFLSPFLFSFFASLGSFYSLVTLPFWISLSWEWSWSQIPVQCHKPPPIDFQVLCLSDRLPWIYFSLPLYNHKGFDFACVKYINSLFHVGKSSPRFSPKKYSKL